MTTEPSTTANANALTMNPMMLGGQAPFMTTTTATIQEIDTTMGDATGITPNMAELTFEEFMASMDSHSQFAHAAAVSHMMTLNDQKDKLIHCYDMIDSGASIHGTPYLFRLRDTRMVQPILVKLADKSVLQLSLMGTMSVDIPRPTTSEVIPHQSDQRTGTIKVSKIEQKCILAS